MADLRHLLAIYVHAHQTGNSVPPHIDAEARTALATEPPAPAEPDTDAVLALAAIIRQVDGSHSLGAAALAEAILSHPDVASVFQPSAPAPAADGERDHVPGAGNMVPAAYAARRRQCHTHGQLPPNYIDPGHTGEDRKLLEAFYVASRAEGGTADEIVLRGLRAAIAADRAARPQPTPEEVEARFRAWWGECYPNVPAGGHTVRSHVAFAMHLLGGEVAA